MQHLNPSGPTESVRQELQFLERVAKRLPREPCVLKPLADLYTSAGFLDEGLLVDRKLVHLCPDESEVWYNLACSYALTDDKDAALKALETAVHRGYQDAEWMGKDQDLESLRGDVRFQQLLKHVNP